MRLLPRGPVAVASRTWQGSRERMITVVARVTFELRPGRCEVTSRVEPVRTADVWVEGEGGRSVVREPSDLAPVKESADILVVGNAHATEGPCTELRVRVLIGEIDKVLRVTGPRRFARDGSILGAAPFREAPIDWTRAAGGDGTWNPVGIGGEPADIRGETPAPTVVAFGEELSSRDSFVSPAGLGPLAPAWPPRRDLLPDGAGGWAEPPTSTPLAWNDALRPTFFQVAPPDQRLHRPIRADERIVLENLHPVHARLVTNLPGVLLNAVVVDASGQQPLTLQADTLLVDATRSLVTVTHRAVVPARAIEGRDVFVWLDGFDGLVDQDIADAGGQTADPLAVELSRDGTPFHAAQPAGSRTQIDEEDEFERFATGTIAADSQLQGIAIPFGPGGARSPSAASDPSPRAVPPLAAPPPPSPSRPMSAAPGTAPPLVAPPMVAGPLVAGPLGAGPLGAGPLGAGPLGAGPLGAGPLGAPPLAAPPMMVPSRVSPPLATPPLAASSAAGGVAAPAWTPAPVQPAPAAPAIDTWKLHEAASARRAPGEATAEVTPSTGSAASSGAAPAAASAPARQVPIETVWFDSTTEVELAGHSRTLREQIGEGDEEWMNPAEAGGGTMERSRRDVARWMRVTPAPTDRLLEMLTRSLETDPAERPFVVVAGELQWVFDARESVRAWIALATPLAADPRVKSAIEAAEQALHEGMVPIQDVLLAALERLRDLVRSIAKLVGSTPIDTAAERYLIEERGFARRRVWGQNRLRAHLHTRGARFALPIYLPDAAGWEAPLAQRIAVRLVGELRSRQDPIEPLGVCLRAIALGIDVDPRSGPPGT